MAVDPAFMPDPTVFMRWKAAEDVQGGDKILTKAGEVKKVAYVRVFDPYDTVQITCIGNYHISTRKGEQWQVDDLDRFLRDTPV